MYHEISEAAFNDSDPAFRVITHDHPRRFGALKLPHVTHSMMLSWRSDRVEPVIAPDPFTSLIWIGIDHRVVSISMQGAISCAFGLMSPLLTIQHFEKFTVILAEVEVVTVHHDLTLHGVYRLSEIAVSADVTGSVLSVMLLTGQTITWAI